MATDYLAAYLDAQKGDQGLLPVGWCVWHPSDSVKALSVDFARAVEDRVSKPERRTLNCSIAIVSPVSKLPEAADDRPVQTTGRRP